MIQITEYNELLDKLLHQYTDSDNLRGIITGFLENANDIETALFEIQDEFYLSNAIGAQLDVLGVVFDVSRSGANDPIYRQSIQEKAVLRYSGEPESIIDMLQSVYGASWVKYRHGETPAQYYIYTDITGVLVDSLDPISPAGVQGFFEKPIVDGNEGFLVDALGRLICSVIEIETLYLTDGQNRLLVDGQGRNITTITFA